MSFMETNLSGIATESRINATQEDHDDVPYTFALTNIQLFILALFILVVYDQCKLNLLK